MKPGVFIKLFLVGFFFSCTNEEAEVETVAARSLAEVASENDTEILEFLQTHCYNYEAFDNPPADFDFRITIDTLAGENEGKTPLMASVSLHEVKVSSSQLSLSGEENDILHTLYYLEARTGTGESPTVADSAFVRYEGKLLDGTPFDASLNNPVWFDLAEQQDFTQGFRGLAEGISLFKAGEGMLDLGNGTVAANGYGVGLLILPSGLAAFHQETSYDIPQYSPLLFTIDLFGSNPADHDGDGIPSIDEDANGNHYLYDDDADSDNTPDYLDPDTVSGS